MVLCSRIVLFAFVVLLNSVRQAARSDVLLPEEAGFMEADDGEATADITQHDIVKAVDMQTAQKVCLVTFVSLCVCLCVHLYVRLSVRLSVRPCVYPCVSVRVSVPARALYVRLSVNLILSNV